MNIPFVGDAYKVKSPILDAQTCINLYPVLDNRGGKAPSALYRTDGLKLFSDDSIHFSVRGAYELNGILYAVIDDTLYSVDDNGSKTSLGTLTSSVGRVDIIDNGLQLLITDDVKNGFVYTFSTKTLTPQTSESWYGPRVVGYQDGYGLLPRPDTTTWYITDLFDFSTISALDFAAANQSNDYLVAVISSHQEVWLLSRRHAEVWYNTGAALFPFERRQTLVIQYGIAAAYSLVKLDNSRLFWLAQNELSTGLVVALNGYTPQIISTEAVTTAINSYERIDDAFGFAYEKNGHLFYVLTFPTADRTWVYDVTTQMWHERRSQINNTLPSVFPTRQGRWRPNCYALFNGKHIVGDFESGKLYEIDPDTHTENGTPITWERTTFHAANDEKYLFINNLQVIMQVGDATNDDDPQVMLQVSKDMARTFGTEQWQSLGKQGEYRKRLLWASQGASYDWVWRLRGHAPVPTAIISARADVEKGD